VAREGDTRGNHDRRTPAEAMEEHTKCPPPLPVKDEWSLAVGPPSRLCGEHIVQHEGGVHRIGKGPALHPRKPVLNAHSTTRGRPRGGGSSGEWAVGSGGSHRGTMRDAAPTVAHPGRTKPQGGSHVEWHGAATGGAWPARTSPCCQSSHQKSMPCCSTGASMTSWYSVAKVLLMMLNGTYLPAEGSTPMAVANWGKRASWGCTPAEGCRLRVLRMPRSWHHSVKMRGLGNSCNHRGSEWGGCVSVRWQGGVERR
jgi:hypothetical protein